MSEQNNNQESKNNIAEILVRSILQNSGQGNTVQFREEHHSERTDSSSQSDTDSENIYTKELEILYILAKNNSKLCEALLSIVKND